MSTETNASEIYTNSSVTSKYICANSSDYSTDFQNLWSFASISPKSFLIIPKNLLNFKFNTVKKQSIINLCSYRSKSYTYKIVDDSKITFLRKGEDAVFYPSLYCILLIYDIA